jgi:hypothetical protein
MNQRAIEKTELNKILAAVAEYAVLDVSKETLCNTMPSSDLEVVKTSLDKTEECKKLLFIHGIGKVEYVPWFSDEFSRAEIGSTLSCAELLSVSSLLRSVRIAYTSISSINDEEIKLMKKVAYVNIGVYCTGYNGRKAQIIHKTLKRNIIHFGVGGLGVNVILLKHIPVTQRMQTYSAYRFANTIHQVPGFGNRPAQSLGMFLLKA